LHGLNYREMCVGILELDRGIRFAGIATMEGKIVAAEYRDGLEPLLTKEESELSIMQSLIRMSTRRTLEAKLGKTIYAFAVYQKIKRATIMMYNEGSKSDSVLMVSFDRETDHELIITDMIMPFLKEVGKSLDNDGS
jgi:hypothetical protein